MRLIDAIMIAEKKYIGVSSDEYNTLRSFFELVLQQLPANKESKILHEIYLSLYNKEEEREKMEHNPEKC